MRLNRKSTRPFYGWWIVGASFVIALYVAGVIVYGFTAIFEPIANELGWSYTQISLAASLRGLEMGLIAPLIGLLVDRYGPRRLIFGGAFVAALGLFLLSRTTSLATFYGAFVLIAIGMSCCSQTVLLTAVTNWFRRKAGIASGIAISGFGFGGLLVLVMNRLIEVYEWRTTLLILALGMLVTVLPLSLLFRHKPEQYGYLPDGEASSAVTLENGVAPLQTIEVDVGVKQALKSRAFWHIAIAFTFYMVMVSSIVTHIMPYLSSIGVTRSTASLVATFVPLISIGGRIGFGWLGDRINKKQIAAGAFVMMVLGSLFFGYAATAGIWLLVPFLILFGIGFGGSNVLRLSLTREFLGRANFGTFFGLIMGINMMGNILGPFLAGLAFDNWGSYQYIWFLFAGLLVISVISVLTIPSVKPTV